MNFFLYAFAAIGIYLLGKSSAQPVVLPAKKPVEPQKPALPPQNTVVLPPEWQLPQNIPTELSKIDTSSLPPIPTPIELPVPGSESESQLFGKLPADVREPIIGAYRTGTPEVLDKLSVVVQDEYPTIANILSTKAQLLRANVATGRARRR